MKNFIYIHKFENFIGFYLKTWNTVFKILGKFSEFEGNFNQVKVWKNC